LVESLPSDSPSSQTITKPVQFVFFPSATQLDPENSGHPLTSKQSCPASERYGMGQIEVWEFLGFLFLQSIKVAALAMIGKIAANAAVTMNFFI
jgi:hypothetical protein